MDMYSMTLGSVLRWQHNAFCPEISSVLEIRFSEPNWYKRKWEIALVRPLFLWITRFTYLFSNK
jgi:hypothetical protein